MTSSQFAASQSFASLFRPLYTQTLEVVFLYHMIWLSSGLLVFFLFPTRPLDGAIVYPVCCYLDYCGNYTSVFKPKAVYMHANSLTTTVWIGILSLVRAVHLSGAHLSVVSGFTFPGFTCLWVHLSRLFIYYDFPCWSRCLTELNWWKEY